MIRKINNLIKTNGKVNLKANFNKKLSFLIMIISKKIININSYNLSITNILQEYLNQCV